MSTRRGRLALSREEYKALTTQVLQRDGFKCRNPKCKRRSSLHCHHIIYRSEQGDDASWNLIVLCNSCHDAVHGRLAGHFIIILPASGNPEDPIDADVGVKFLVYGEVRKRVKLRAKK